MRKREDVQNKNCHQQQLFYSSSHKSELSKTLSTFAGLVGAITLSQSFSVPLLNMLHQKYVLPDARYHEIARNLYQTGNLYNQAKSNTIRRIGVSMIPITMASTLQGKYNLTNIETATISATAEAILSYCFNEAKEKKSMSGIQTMSAPDNIRKSYGFIWARNFAFANSVFCAKTFAKDISDQIDDKTFERMPFKREDFAIFTEQFARLSLVTLTTPLDAFATKLANGDSFTSIFKSYNHDPRLLLNGGVARTVFSGLASATIVFGIDIGKKINNYIESKQTFIPLSK